MYTKTIAAALLLAAVVPFAAFAADLRMGKDSSILPTENVLDDVYIIGRTATGSGSVRGDFIGTGGTVLLNGSVGGDVLAAGGTVSILGLVADDVRVAGGNVLVGGNIASDVFVAGGQVQLAGVRIGGDAIVTGGSVRIDTPIEGDARFTGGDIYINAPIAGNVEVKADRVTIGSAARISGTLNYAARKEAQIEVGAVVSGGMHYTERKNMHGGFSAAGLIALLSLWFVFTFLMLLVSALLITLLLKRYAREMITRASVEPWLEVGVGLVIFIVLPVVSVMLLLTLIGIPLGALGLLAFGASVLWGVLLSPVILGSFLDKWMFSRTGYELSWKTTLLGVAVYCIIGLIPFVGGLVHLVLILLSLGVTMRLKWNLIQEWR